MLSRVDYDLQDIEQIRLKMLVLCPPLAEALQWEIRRRAREYERKRKRQEKMERRRQQLRAIWQRVKLLPTKCFNGRPEGLNEELLAVH